jgi:ankyrin repeat protein
MQASELFAMIARSDDAAVLTAVRAEPVLAAARSEQGVSVVCLAMYRQRRALAAALAALRSDLDIFEASCVGDVERVRALLAVDPQQVDAVSPDGFGPLGFSAFFGHLPLLRELIACGANVNAASRNPMRVQPLHSAAALADHATATAMGRALLEAGADPDARQQGGYTPLHEAAATGKLALLSLLLARGADPSLRNDQGEDALDLARARGMREALELLHGAAATQGT